MPHLMQGSRPACWLERAICIFYVTETCALPRGLAGRSNAQLVLHGGIPETRRAGKGDSPVAGSGLALLGSLKRLPMLLQQTWGWWQLLPLPQRCCFLLSVQVGILLP